MTVTTLLKAIDFPDCEPLSYAINILVDGPGKPLNAKVDTIRIHRSGSIFISAVGSQKASKTKAYK